MSHILEFLDLVDVPNTYSGLPGRPVIINATVDGVTFSDLAADYVAPDTTDFNGLFSSSEDTLQKALDLIDDLTHGDLPGLDEPTDHPQYHYKTGWNSRYSSAVSMSFTDGTRTFEIAPTGASFEYWIQGVKYTKTTAQSVVIDDTQGMWFIYFDEGTLTASQTPWIIYAQDVVFVAVVYWDTQINDEAIRVEYELHGWTMDGATHEYAHETFGCRWSNGLAVTENPTNQLEITGGTLHDEDLHFGITDDVGSGMWDQTLSPASLPVLYRQGAAGNWARVAASTTPVHLISNIPQVNVYSGATWQLQNVGNNQYFVYWVVGSGDIYAPIFLVPGQEASDNLSGTRDGNALADMQFGNLPTPEHKVLARVLMRRSNSSPYYSIEEIADYRNVIDEPSGTAAIIGDHGGLTGLSDPDHPASAIFTSTTNFDGALSTSETTVQAALDVLDDVCQELEENFGNYLLINGTVPLTADWDAGSFEIRAESFQSDVATGTAPLTIASTTLVNNLNADLLDGVQNSAMVHNNVAGEINALTEVTPAGTDVVLAEDASDSWNKKKLEVQDIRAHTMNLSNTGIYAYINVKNSTGSGMSKGDLVYVSGDDSGTPTVTLADADAESSSKGMLLMLNVAIANGATGAAMVLGTVTGFSSLTVGAPYYVSTTAGGITVTAPSGSGDIVRVIGYAISTTEIFFNPGASWVEVA